MAGRIYAILKRLQMKGDVNPDELAYKIRDLEGNTVSKKEARKIIRKEYPSKAERFNKEKRNKLERKMIVNKVKKERLPLTDISRQSPNQTRINSSQIRGKSLHAKNILDNIISGAYLQDPTLDEHQKKFFDKLVNLWESKPVDNLGKEGGNFPEKST